MKRMVTLVALGAVLAAGCGGGKDDGDGEASVSGSQWSSSPERVVQGLMVAYETRDDSLYAALLAEDFRYYFEPPGAGPDDVLGWGKEEDLVATTNLFRTPDVESLALVLDAGAPRPAGAGKDGDWMMIPITGGELRVAVREKEAMEVQLNRQEIYVRPDSAERWQVIEWRDYPEPDRPGAAPADTAAAGASGHEGHGH